MLTYDIAIIGSGAAAYSAADWLTKYGEYKICIVTEGKNCGTSRNAGSDKQTYYKMSLTDLDSPEKMARALSFGGGMHGDTAYIEASNSLRCFMRLADYGVPFPTDELGRFVGYKTDHDEACRGTSAGPLTSKYMTECLEKRVLSHNNITLIDNAQVIKIVTGDNRAAGLLYLVKTDDGYEINPLKARYIIIATGGAAGIYRDSVYPRSQHGALGLAVEAGCELNNFCEWQYGIASTDVRWNLSGSYQQVIPRYYSVDENGNEYEFLNRLPDACDLIFLKGYQWPFDSKKASGSSRVDIAVNEEMKAGRQVFMDFRRNPENFLFNSLSEEARDYLINAGALGDTPVERLERLNPQAIAFYRSKGIDLFSEPLKIAVCAQHMNGGIKVDTDWQTDVRGLFAAGEAAGTFGVYRPGGSALNSTQVAGLRIAECISRNALPGICSDGVLENAVSREYEYIDKCINAHNPQKDFTEAMSLYAGFSRVYEEIEKISADIISQLHLKYYSIENTYDGVKQIYRYRDTLITQDCLCRTLTAVIDTVGSRGGAISLKNGAAASENTDYLKYAAVTASDRIYFEPLRDMPDGKYNFERVWQKYNAKNGLNL